MSSLPLEPSKSASTQNLNGTVRVPGEDRLLTAVRAAAVFEVGLRPTSKGVFIDWGRGVTAVGSLPPQKRWARAAVAVTACLDALVMPVQLRLPRGLGGDAGGDS